MNFDRDEEGINPHNRRNVNLNKDTGMNIKLFSTKDLDSPIGWLGLLLTLSVVGAGIVLGKAMDGELCSNPPKFSFWNPLPHAARITGCFARGLIQVVPNPLSDGGGNAISPPKR